jgi:hypothetical protein
MEFEEPKKRPGRPKGSRNKSPEVQQFIKQFEHIYERVEHLMNDEQRDYYQKAFAGQAPFDPIKDAELFMRLYGIYSVGVVGKAIEEGKASESIAQTAAQYRMGLKDLFDMQSKREEAKDKDGNKAGVADPTRKPEMALFEDLHR